MQFGSCYCPSSTQAWVGCFSRDMMSHILRSLLADFKQNIISNVAGKEREGEIITLEHGTEVKCYAGAKETEDAFHSLNNWKKSLI